MIALSGASKTTEREVRREEGDSVRQEPNANLLLEELLREARVVVRILDRLTALREVRRHHLGTVVCLFLGQILRCGQNKIEDLVRNSDNSGK